MRSKSINDLLRIMTVKKCARQHAELSKMLQEKQLDRLNKLVQRDAELDRIAKSIKPLKHLAPIIPKPPINLKKKRDYQKEQMGRYPKPPN